MITQFLVQTTEGTRLATREAFMMNHPSLDSDCALQAGEVIELKEGYFVLNQDLNPMELATEEQIQQAQTQLE